MMRTMRSIAPWIMLVVAVSFVGWMVFDVGMDVTGRGGGGNLDEIATVNGTKIDLETFYAAVRNAQEQQRLQGAPVATTLEEQRALEDAVLEQLIQQVLIEGEYERRGITVTDREVRDALLNLPLPEIQQEPAFQTDSQFDLAKYQRYLRSGADPTFALVLEARYREELPRLKFMERITEDVYVSDAKLWRIYQDQHDSVTANVLALVPAAVAGDSEPSEEDLQRYYRDHQDEFERPAHAALSFVAISRVPDPVDSAAALARVEAVRQEILDGTDFAAVAARESADSANRQTGGDLGEVQHGAFVPAFEEVALALRPGQLSQPVLTPFGYHLIKLDSKTDSTYHARHILIPIELQGEHLDQVDARADSLDLLAADLDDPTALDTVAARLDVPVAQAGPVYEGDRLQLGRYLIPDVGIWAFEAGPGQTSAVIEADWAYYVFRLDSLIPPGVPPLEEVRSGVLRLTRREQQWESARAKAQAIAQEIRGGTDLEQAATRHSVRVQTLGPFTRLDPTSALRDSPAAVGAVFGLPVGAEGGPFETEFAIYFVEPIRKVFADSTAFVEQAEELRADIIRQAGQARIQLIVSSLREQASVVDRRRELEQARQRAPDSPLQGPLGFLK